MSMLDEYKQIQQKKNAGATAQTQRKSMLQEYVDKNGADGLNKDYVDYALKNGGGFGATGAGIRVAEDGSRYIQTYTKPKTQDELWREKYQGKSRDDLLKTLDTLEEDSDERKWLEEYSWSDDIMTVDDYKKLIYQNETALEDFLENEDYDATDTNSRKAYDKQVADYEAELERLRAGQWRVENKEKFGGLSENADFKANSAPLLDEYGKFGNYTYHYINDENVRKTASAQGLAGGGARSEERKGYDLMTDEEREMYNYLYHVSGKKAAKEYLDYLEYELGARRNQKIAGVNAQFATEMPGLASVISIPANLVSGIGYLDVAGQNAIKGIKEAVTGEYAGPINYNSAAMTPSVTTTSIRGTVAANLAENSTIELDEEEHPVLSRLLNGKSWGDVYQLGMSMADSTAVALLSPLMGSAGTVLLGGSAATQGVLDAVANGATDGQALTLGIINGVAEWGFEKIGMDNLVNKIIKGDKAGIVRALLTQGLAEGGEELGTSFVNTVADHLVMAENSGYSMAIEEYIAQGYSEEEAAKRALQDIAISMGWDFFGGMLSGGIMGSGGHVIGSGLQTVQDNKTAKQLYGPQASEIANRTLELDPDNKQVQKLQTKLDKGGKASGRQLSKLVDTHDNVAIASAAETRLKALGETENVKELSTILAKQAAGETLSRAERRTISGSLYGERVSNELNPENIRSEEYSSAWTGEINTKRINAAEYSRLIAEAQVDAIAEESSVVEAPQVKPATVAENATVQNPVAVAENAKTTETAQAPAKTVTIEEASKKYGAQAGAMLHTYKAGQDVEKYDAAYQRAYDMGKSGVSLDYVKKSSGAAYLTETQRELAYEAGKAAAGTEAKAKDATNKQAANGKTGRKKGTVSGEGVTGTDLQTAFGMNSTQARAYNILVRIAEVTGIDIVLYKSEPDSKGNLRAPEHGNADGEYRRREPGKLYIDINAGLTSIKGADQLSKYTMLRTFSHEFVHFVENWNPIQYNEFRRVVFDTITERGHDVEALIDAKMNDEGLSFEAASREVVAEGLTDILPDSNFIQELAENHKTIFDKLLEKLKEFIADIKAYFDGIVDNQSKEAIALKGALGYAENIVKLFDQAAVQAVENYQATVAVEEDTRSSIGQVNAETIESIVEETVAENATFEAKAEPKTSTSENGYTITDNTEYNSIEIKFNVKPAQTVIDVLKANKFRWHKAKGVWYGKTTHEAIMEALDKAYEAEKSADIQDDIDKVDPAYIRKKLEEMGIVNGQVVDEEKLNATEIVQMATAAADAQADTNVPKAKPNPVVENTVKAAERAADPNDPYARLEGVMNSLSRFYTGGFLFRVIKAGKGNAFWMAEITAATQKDGFEIVNARGLKYQSELFESRREAVEDLIAVARNNRLLNIEEVKTDGENADNNGTVRQPDSDRQGDSQVLEELQAGDVQGDAQQQILAEPFSKQAELEQKRARFNEIMEILNPKEEQTIADDDTVQHQARKYLDEAVDNFDGGIYSNVKLSGAEFNKFQSEAMTWHADKVGKVVHQTIGRNTYVYSFDADHNITIYNKYQATNIHERQSVIDDKRNRRTTDRGNDRSRGGGQSDTSDLFSSDRGAAGRSSGLSGKSLSDPRGSDGGRNAENAFDSDTEQHQQRSESLTDRDILAMAAREIKVDDLTDGEQDALRIFKERLDKLEALQVERAEQGRLYKEQQFGPNVDREAAKATKNRMDVLDQQINRASAEVLSVEDKQVLKRVLQKAKAVVEQQKDQQWNERLKRYRDRRDNAAAIKKYRNRIRGDVDELSNWILHPNNKDVVKHVPDALKDSVIPFLSSINFMSKRSLAGGDPTVADEAFKERLKHLEAALNRNIDIEGLYSGYNDLPPDFMKNMKTFIETVDGITKQNRGEFIINQMTADELQELSKLVRTLKKYIMQVNRFHANAMYQHVYDAGDNSIEFMGELKNAGNTGIVSNFMLWQQMRPAYAFERFGSGGMSIYDGLRRGQSTLAFNTKKITEFAEAAYTAAEVKAWEDEVKTIRLGPAKSVTMKVSQIMSLYELNKREQAKGHILGDGIRVATFKDGKTKISDEGHALTPGELNLILKELTPRQKEVADQLQQFMAKQGGEWGNHVSVARWGEELFGEEHYFPINSDGRRLQSTAEENPSEASLYALLNMSFTKELQEGADNRIILYSIFDVFANHMASMAQYNAFALPVLDALKWFNYQQKSEADEHGKRVVLSSVREQMDRKYGVPEETRPGKGKQGYAESFVINIIKAFNGTEAQGIPADETGMKALRQYNMAQVAYNFRVVVQQPLAITRAALLIDYDSIIKGMRLKPAAIQKNIEEMRLHSGIAAWKSLGFYDINISRGLTDLIKHDTDWRDKVSDIGMWGAEKADALTWAGIWSAAKEQVIKKQGIKLGDEGFFEAVTQLFEDVIYKTQVVDSVLTKNEYLRSKGFFARAMASFMSEPTTTASMLIDAYDKYAMDKQRGMTKQQAWQKNRSMIVRVAYVYGIGAVVLAAAQAVADAFRDDDDYQNFFEKWLEAFGGNLFDEIMPFNKLPLVNDVYDLAKELLSSAGLIDSYGNPPTSVYMQWWDSLVKGVQIFNDKIRGKETDYTWYGGAYKLLQAASGMTGLPMAAATRELVTAWNNTVGVMAPSLKVKTYEPSETAQIKYAYQDGWLTEDEAVEQLISQGLVDNENEAYWTMREWESGDDFSRYDAIYEAVRNGGDFNSAMDELTSHGYSEKDVISKVKSQIGTWYREGEVTKQQAISMLTKYADMPSEEITKTVNKWSAVVVTGIAYDDIKDEYLAGNITASRAAEMYVKYGGMSTEDAQWRVKVYEWQKAGYDIDDSNKSIVEDYETHCQPAGIDKGTYYDAYLFYKDSGVEGESYSKTKETMPYINSLPLTKEQKTALALCWWAESTVNRYKLW